MTPEAATALLAKMGPTCSLCGAVNPPTVPARTQFGTTVPEHEECPKATQKMIAGLRPPAALSIDECRDALATVVEHAATIARLERELAERDAAYLNLAREMDARGFELRAAHAETSRAKGDRIEALALVERVEAEAREQDNVVYALRRVIAMLPECRECRHVSTRHYAGRDYCDDHSDLNVYVDHPWAYALRDLKKVAT